MKPPTAVGLPASLLADTVSEVPQTQETTEILSAAQTLLAKIQPDDQEETLMFIMDVPTVPAQEPPMMVAEATTTQSAVKRYDRVIGVCHLSENPYDPTSAVNSMSPPLEVKNYFREREHYKIEGQPSVSVLQMPAHGTLLDNGGGDYVYYPEKGYLGNDRAALLVEVGGKRVKLEYFFRVMQSIPQQYEGLPNKYEESNCPKKTAVWKISSATDVYGNSFIAAVDYQLLTENTSGVSGSAAATWASTLSTTAQSGIAIDTSGNNRGQTTIIPRK